MAPHGEEHGWPRRRSYFNLNTTDIPDASADLAEDPFHDELDESTSESDDDEDSDLEDGRA